MQVCGASLQQRLRDRLIDNAKTGKQNHFTQCPEAGIFRSSGVSSPKNLFQPENVTIFVRRTGDGRPPGPCSSPSCKEPLVGAGGLLAGDDDLRNTRLTQFDRKKNQDYVSFHVRGGEYVTHQMFNLPMKVLACFRSSFSV